MYRSTHNIGRDAVQDFVPEYGSEHYASASASAKKVLASLSKMSASDETAFGASKKLFSNSSRTSSHASEKLIVEDNDILDNARQLRDRVLADTLPTLLAVHHASDGCVC